MINDFISIIIIVFNEGKNISQAILGIEKYVKTRHEIIIVYDFESDDTIPVVKNLQKRFKSIKLIKNTYENGVIPATKTGLNNAKGNLIVIMTPDRADDPKTIDKMLSKMREGYDVVCGTRNTAGGQRLDRFTFKTALSVLACILAPYLLGISTTDITNGFKMYKTDVIRNIPIRSTGGWEFSLELIIKAQQLNYRIVDIPTVSKSRIYGVSRFKLFIWLPKYLKWYIWGIAKNLQRKLHINS